MCPIYANTRLNFNSKLNIAFLEISLKLLWKGTHCLRRNISELHINGCSEYILSQDKKEVLKNKQFFMKINITVLVCISQKNCLTKAKVVHKYIIIKSATFNLPVLQLQG